jgi:hypothetical protein
MSSSRSDFAAQVYNVNTTHPLIPNSQEYVFYKKYISIHSEDRDVTKYPNASEFEIELPEDYLNVAGIRLSQWTFPSNYNTFSMTNANTYLAFSITTPYNPGANNVSNTYLQRVFEALWNNQSTPYSFLIEDGFYNPLQMATELTNQMNAAVTNYLAGYFTQQGWTDSLGELYALGGYTRFVVVFHSVGQKLWFGNSADGFTILSELSLTTNAYMDNLCASGRQHVPDASNWGLPGYLGLPRCNATATNGSSLSSLPSYLTSFNGQMVPRFYYGDITPGDNGYWLLPLADASGAQVQWIESMYKANLLGEGYMYMEIAGWNCIDETQPYSVSNFTLTTNGTNGIVNSSFAKLPVPATPLSQWFDRDSVPYKLYYPPAERIRKMRVKLRYHNGQAVQFGVSNYSFMIEFTMMVPQILRESRSNVFPPPMGR